MKTRKKKKRRSDATTAVHVGSENVFEDLGLSSPEDRLAKAELAHQICSRIAALRLTQTEAGARLRIDQPRVSDLRRGKLDQFSAERLLTFLLALDHDVFIVIRPAKRRHHATVRVVSEDLMEA